MAYTLKDALGLIDDLLAVCRDVGDAALEKDTDLAGCGAMFLARGAQSVLSAGLLAQHGLNGDAMSVARTVTELAIDYRYIALDPDVRLRRFREYDHVSKFRLAEAIADLLDGAVDSQAMRILEERHDMARENNPQSNHNWAGVSIRSRAIAVDESGITPISRLRLWRLVYADMCDASHSCYATLEYAFEGSGEDRQLVFGRMPPDLKPADLAFSSMLILADDVLTINDLGPALTERFKAIVARRHSDNTG